MTVKTPRSYLIPARLTFVILEYNKKPMKITIVFYCYCKDVYRKKSEQYIILLSVFFVAVALLLFKFEKQLQSISILLVYKSC